MKYIFTQMVFIIAASTAFAAPWGILGTADVNSSAGYVKPLIYKLAEGQAVTYCIDNFSGTEDARLAKKIEQSFNDWMSNTVKFINKSGRKDEFSDLIPILSRPVAFNRIDCGAFKTTKADLPDFLLEQNKKRTIISNEDIRFVFVDKLLPNVCGEGVDGCYFSFSQKEEGAFLPGVMFVTSNDNGYTTLVHETGHALGLSDQYLSARVSSSARYGSSQSQNAIMKSSSSLQCDDAEGIINLLDCVVLNKPRGGEQGWHSICRDSDDVYVNCNAKDRAEAINVSKDGKKVFINTYDEHGLVKQISMLPFSGNSEYDIFDYPAHNFTEQRQDNKNRIIYLKDENGVETKIDYPEDGMIRTFTLSGKEQPSVGAYSTIKGGHHNGYNFATITRYITPSIRRTIRLTRSYTPALRDARISAELLVKSNGEEETYSTFNLDIPSIGPAKFKFSISEQESYFALISGSKKEPHVDICINQFARTAVQCRAVDIDQNGAALVTKQEVPQSLKKFIADTNHTGVQAFSFTNEPLGNLDEKQSEESFSQVAFRAIQQKRYVENYFGLYFKFAPESSVAKTSGLAELKRQIKNTFTKKDKYKL